MNEQEKLKLELKEDGMQALRTLERICKSCIQESEFPSADYWLGEYRGGAKVLEMQRLISTKEYVALTGALFEYYRRAHLPEAFEKEPI